MRLHRPLRTDDGAILILALIVITVVALVTGALLLQGGTNFAATANLRKAAGTSYAADAAAKQAINDLELGNKSSDVVLPSGFISASRPTWVFDNNIDGTGCFGNSGTTTTPVQKTSVDLKGFYTDSQSGTSYTATVVCTPVQGTGIFDTGPTNPGTYTTGTGGSSTQALTILGSGSGALTLKVLGGSNAPFSMHGDIVDRGDLAVTPNGSTMYTNGTVTASSCTPTSAVIADKGKNCSATGPFTDPLASVDPNPLPTDVNGNWKVGTWSGCTFQPGYYDDAGALSAATAACATATFVPGTYYFDFHNNSTDPTFSKPAMSAGSTGAGGSQDIWSIGGNTKLIAGDTTVPGLTSNAPGMCQNPIDTPATTTVNGVQFIFGGDSHLYLANGTEQVELCASTSTTAAAPIAFYGLDGSSAARGQLLAGYGLLSQRSQTNSALMASNASASGSPTFAPTYGTLSDAVANPLDLNVASASFPASTTDTATLALGGLVPSTVVPPGSTLKTATLQVWHKDDPGATPGAAITPSLAIKVGSGAPTATANQPVNQPTGLVSALVPDSIDVTNELAPLINAGKLGSAQFLFSEAGKKGAIGTVAGVQLVLTYWPPMLRGETTTAIPSNCLLATDSTHCSVIDGSNGSSQQGSFVVQGATYVPSDSLNLALGNHAGVISLRWSLVANTASLQSQNSFPFAYPVISIPDPSTFDASITAVDLQVHLCSAALSTCPTGGATALTSRVMFTDPRDPTTELVAPAPLQRQVTVLSWAEQR